MPNDSAPQPRPTRIELNVPANVRLDDGTCVSAIVLDLSSGGFRLRSDEYLQIGEQVVVEMVDSDPVRAEIRWASGGEAGGVFLEPIPDLYPPTMSL